MRSVIKPNHCIISCRITSSFHNQAEYMLLICPGPTYTHKRHTVHVEELINRPFNSSDINTRRTLVSHRLTISLLQSLGRPGRTRFRVQRHRVSVRDAHLCPWSTLFPTRRRSSEGLARYPRSISSAPCRAPTRKPGDALWLNVLRDASSPEKKKMKVRFTRWRGYGDPRRWASLLDPSELLEDAGRMRSGDKAVRTEETPTDTEMTLKFLKTLRTQKIFDHLLLCKQQLLKKKNI